MSFFPVLPFSKRSFLDLKPDEVLALAIGAEEEDARRYREMAARLFGAFPASAKIFEEMALEEDNHRRMLIDMFQEKYGNYIPLIRREDIRGFSKPQPVWLMSKFTKEMGGAEAARMEMEAERFYLKAAERSNDPDIRRLLGDLAAMEAGHEKKAQNLADQYLTPDAASQEHIARKKQFVLQIVQPGLAGLMDGSVSTLAPLFAAAFATHSSWEAFLVGLAASVGAGISMGMTEAMSDDGVLTGRGHPWIRGIVCGVMTTVGGLAHTLPYLIPDFKIATSVAAGVVFVELWAISWIRAKYMDTPFLRAAFQVVVGGILVFLAGIFIGSA